MQNSSVDISYKGLDKKVKNLIEALDKDLVALMRDKAAYINAELIDKTLNGPAGQDYPKSGYPTGIVRGGGYVGRNTGRLAASTRIRKIRGKQLGYRVEVNQAGAGVGEYAGPMMGWAKDKYGLDYMEIHVKIYSGYANKQTYKSISSMTRAIKNGRKYNYRNPF